jgi:hypothetical protein
MEIISPAPQDPFGLVKRRIVVLNDTELKALNSSPTIIVPAPGAGKIITIVNVFAKLTSFGAYGNLTDTRLRYSSGVNYITISTSLLASAVDFFLTTIGGSTDSATSLVNNSIQFFDFTNPTGGHANNKLKFTVHYIISPAN